MNEIPTKSSPKRDPVVDSSTGPVSTNSVEAPTLITEQQVLFSSAALALPPARTRRLTQAAHAVARAVGAWLVSAAKPSASPRYPKRHVWLEDALMSREMDRL